MLINYLKTSLRVLRKHKFFSFLNISSLSLGLFPCILLLLLLQYEYSFDTFHDQPENIYRIVFDWHQKSGPFQTIYTTPKLAEANSSFQKLILGIEVFEAQPATIQITIIVLCVRTNIGVHLFE